ncbi:MAG TPA: hypothetical protein VKM55_04585 [Candidatus Lokiarchaeia archaeon]|nr:hypothetical protein [Candidatus Lokiarchaeia archaeon]
MTVDELLNEYDGLTRDDVSAYLLFASSVVDDIMFLLIVDET